MLYLFIYDLNGMEKLMCGVFAIVQFAGECRLYILDVTSRLWVGLITWIGMKGDEVFVGWFCCTEVDCAFCMLNNVFCMGD